LKRTIGNISQLCPPPHINILLHRCLQENHHNPANNAGQDNDDNHFNQSKSALFNPERNH
jgi:hypothetical protein